MKSEVVIITFTDPEDKYYSFIEEKRYNSPQEFEDNFITFLTTLFPFLKVNSSLGGFNLIYDKIEEEIENIKGFRNILGEINKYIDAYNFYRRHWGVDIGMARVTERCWEILNRTDSRLIDTRKDLTDTRTQLDDTRIELSNTQTRLANTETNLVNTETKLKKTVKKLKKDFIAEVARLEKIIDDLKNK